MKISRLEKKISEELLGTDYDKTQDLRNVRHRGKLSHSLTERRRVSYIKEKKKFQHDQQTKKDTQDSIKITNNLMTRPLRYDDSFKNIINEKIHDKFLYFFNIKVQSTAFNQKLNLQRSLVIASAYDLLIGIIITLHFFNNINEDENFLYFIESFILLIGICFSFVGFDAANNLRKSNSRIYKNWRICVTFSTFLLEVMTNFQLLCGVVNSSCSGVTNVILCVLFLVINIYLTKIAWSFYIRLVKGHELLVIHGKYLETMMNEESYKIADVRRFVPPEQLMNVNIKNVQNDMMNMELKNRS